jgi:hypothetical protein
VNDPSCEGFQLETDASRKHAIDHLRAELSRYDYVAMPREHVRRFQTQSYMSNLEVINAKDMGRYLECVKARMGSELGRCIVDSGATSFTDVYDATQNGRIWRMSTQVILTDPNFDKPPQWRKQS